MLSKTLKRTVVVESVYLGKPKSAIPAELESIQGNGQRSRQVRYRENVKSLAEHEGKECTRCNDIIKL